MTCKDCIHYDLCMDKFKKQYSIYADKNITVDECEHFKNKADFVEVVRCRECKYSREQGKVLGVTSYKFCSKHNISCLSSYDFCSYGERKDT